MIGIVYAVLSIGFIGSVVWAHHIYIVGIDLDRRAYFTSATIIIAVPTGVKIYSWILTLFGVRLVLRPTVMWMTGFLVLFTIGGLTGVILASSRLDVLLHDSWFVVAHFHYVLSLGRVFGILLGISLYWGIFFGLRFRKLVWRIFFWRLFTGVNITFFPLHRAGLQGGNRKFAQNGDHIQWLHSLRSFGSIISLWGLFSFLLGIWESGYSFRLILGLAKTTASGPIGPLSLHRRVRPVLLRALLR